MRAMHESTAMPVLVFPAQAIFSKETPYD